jgi:GNAT superfamily N-acetyltransferase
MARDEAVGIRFAQPADCGQIVAFIRELAEYERMLDQCVSDEAALRAALFGPRPWAEVLLAEDGGQPAGFALFFHNFSTFAGRPGLYLEDLFVRPQFRKRGIGFRLLRRLAEIALERGCARMEWAVLDWNQPAIDFYERLGARRMTDWHIYRLTGAPLAALASEAGSSG